MYCFENKKWMNRYQKNLNNKKFEIAIIIMTIDCKVWIVGKQIKMYWPSTILIELLFQISAEKIRDGVIGITGDGAFAKSNKPFENTVKQLFEKDIQIRWDLLHLINCAHKEVRGKTKKESIEEDEEKEIASDEEDKDSNGIAISQLNEDDLELERIKIVDEVRELVEYIQIG